MKAVEFYEAEYTKSRDLKINSNALSDEKSSCVFNINTQQSRADVIMNELKLSNCSENELSFIKKLVKAFPLQFYLEGDILSSTDVIKHCIYLITDSKPVFIRQYRIPMSHREKLQEIIDSYEEQGIIEKSQSNFNSPVILVNKKDQLGGKESFRLVVDYRKLNQITEIQNFPIPLIDDILTWK